MLFLTMVKLVNTSTKFELSPTLAANEMVIKRRAEGKDVLHMGFGESPFPVPERLKKSLYNAAHRKDYLPTSGLPDLCQAALEYYQDKIGIDANKYDLIVAPGSKLILYGLQMAIEGDLLMPVPSWVSYEPQAMMLHTQIIKFPMEIGHNGLRIDPDNLTAAILEARSNGLNPSKLILNSPSNPTGLIIPEENLKEIADVCKAQDIFILSDEIYGFVSFDDQYRTISKYAPDITAISTGLSKHLSLGGWRIGIGLIPKQADGLYQLLCHIASETWSCVPAPIQQACIDAYKGHEDIETHIKACTRIHAHINQYLSAGLKAAGLNHPQAQGAFYNYPDFDAYRNALANIGVTTSEQLSAYLLEHYGLVSLPGTAFGEAPDRLCLRLSGCDYDGEKALIAFQQGSALDECFIDTHVPNIKAQVNAFADFVTKLKASNA